MGPSSVMGGLYLELSSESEEEEDDSSTCCGLSSFRNLLTWLALIICLPFAIIVILLQLAFSWASINIVAENFSPG